MMTCVPDCNTKRIVLAEPWDKEHVILETRGLAADAGFNQSEQMMIATAASELSTNILRHAGKGELFVKIVSDRERLGIEILAVDQGPGIDNVEQAMEDHFSTVRGSLGLGLPSVRRIMDDFQIESAPGQGTRIMARKWINHGKR